MQGASGGPGRYDIGRILAATRGPGRISEVLVSNALASLLAIVLLIGLAFYFVAVPPPGFEKWGHRLAIPLVLVIGASTVFESLRMRTHISQLVGALRGLMGRTGAPPTPEVKREAVEILVKSMRSANPGVRRTASAQLRNLTGQDLGESAEAWEEWWERNRDGFGAPGTP
jgi:hypothetical protein